MQVFDVKYGLLGKRTEKLLCCSACVDLIIKVVCVCVCVCVCVYTRASHACSGVCVDARANERKGRILAIIT